MSIARIPMSIHRLLARRGALVWDRVLGWMLVYGAAIGLSSLAAHDRLLTLAALLAYLREVVLVFVLINLFRTVPGLRFATWALVAAGATFAGVALLHAGTGYDFGGLSTATRYSVPSGSVIRFEGPFAFDSNHFAQLLVTFVPLALYRVWDERRPLLRLAALGAVSLLGIVIVWTFSRGGLLALLLVLGVALAMQRLRPAWLLVLGLALAPVILAAPRLYWERIGMTIGYVVPADLAPASVASSPVSVNDPSARVRKEDSVWERSQQLQVGMLMFLDHPLTGIGRRNYGSVYPEYFWRVDLTLPANPRGPHNVPVHIAAETGLLGLASFAALLVVAVVGVRDAKRRFADAGHRGEAMLLEAVEIAIYGSLAASMFLNWNSTQRYLYVLLGLAAIGRQLALRSVSSARPATPVAAPLAQPT